jgi:hypothetical protein
MEKLNTIINQIKVIIVGVRTSGEKINLEYGKMVPYQTSTPPHRLSENEWNRQFRVSSLHNVHQAVYLG